MNKIVSYGLAAIATALLAPPVFADKGDRGDGGGHGHGGGGGGGGGARMSAPAHVSAPVQRSAPTMRSANVMRAPSAPQFATQSQKINRSQPQLRQEFRSQPGSTFSSSTAQNRSFRQRNAPSVAFGGTATNNTRNFSTTNPRVTSSSSSRDFSRPPMDISRSWDHSRVHEWNNHRWRWFGGDWIIIDAGLPYAYGGYYDDYGYPDTYSTEVIGDSSDSLAMRVQDRLTRLGYSPGPVDGVIGAQTRDALADFQNDNRLPVTGSINTATLRALGL